MDLLGLPCSRKKHDSCAGAFVLGFVGFRRQHECLCPCHFIAAERERVAHVNHPSMPTTSIEMLST